MTSKQPTPYDSVLIEQLLSKMDTVIESISSSESRLSIRMDQRFDAHDARFDVVEGVLHQHSLRLTRIEARLDEIAGKVSDHDVAIQELRSD